MALMIPLTDYPGFAMSSSFFKSWAIDARTREFIVELQNGEVIRKEMEAADACGGSEVRLSIFDWESWTVQLVTNRNHLVVSEAYLPWKPDRTYGRPIVYLDQNHWSTVAQAMADPDRVAKKSEVGPALELIRLAQDDGVILPISSGHLRETSPLTGDRRYEVGVAMANFSAGWQMRHPSRVGRNEHVKMLAVELGLSVPQSATVPIFTLEPHALLDDAVEASARHPSDHDLFKLILTSPEVILQVLLDPGIKAGKDPVAWVARNQEITDFIRTARLSKEQKRNLAAGFIWGDNGLPVHEALRLLGASPDLRTSFDVARQQTLLNSQPLTRAYTQLFIQRHISKTTRWKANDLIDMMYLSCAAGYADYVVAENQTGTQLMQSQRSRNEPVTVFTSLASAVDTILSDGALTATERAAVSLQRT